jgi:hypothetical protein
MNTDDAIGSFSPTVMTERLKAQSLLNGSVRAPSAFILRKYRVFREGDSNDPSVA